MICCYTYTHIVVTWSAQDAWSSAPQKVTDLFVHDPLSSSGYPMIIYTHPIADNLTIKTFLVAR